MTIKIYDCSNSAARPPHRGKPGIVENTIVTILKKYAINYGCEFVDSPKDATVIFTNDVFDKVYRDQYKVKRMDGIFLTPETYERNIPLINAAVEANHVIFISDYSLKTYKHNYSEDMLKKFSVVENWVDVDLFFPQEGSQNKNRLRFAACCTDWNRPEKRLNEIIKLAKLNKDIDFYIFGECNINLPTNIFKIGFLPNFLWAQCIRSFDGFINTSYRDACPKVVIEAIASGIPVLAAKSGGTVDLGKYGHVEFILDNERLDTDTPNLELKDGALEQAFYTFKQNNWNKQCSALDWAQEHSDNMFNKMLESYFKILKDY